MWPKNGFVAEARFPVSGSGDDSLDFFHARIGAMSGRRYEEFPTEGWPQWCEKQVEQADFVVIVCTETYHRRFQGEAPKGTGKGVKWEAAIIRQDLYDAEAHNDKFISALFAPADAMESALSPVSVSGLRIVPAGRYHGYRLPHATVGNGLLGPLAGPVLPCYSHGNIKVIMLPRIRSARRLP